MKSIVTAIIALRGWRRIGVAVLAGGVSALALPPFLAFPLLWLTFPVFVWLIDGTSAGAAGGIIRRLSAAAAVGWAFGFGYFLAGLWWLGAAFLVEAEQFLWLMPFAVIALPAGLALFWGLGAALARAFWLEGWPRLIVFAVAMGIAEWLRGHLFTGLPWNAVGYTLTPAPLMMQTAAVIGVWGLTLAALFIFAAPAALVRARGDRPWSGGIVLAVAAAMLLAHLGYGVVRLPAGPVAIVPDIRLRIVQPAIPQAEKWQADNAERIFQQFLRLSEAISTDPSVAPPNVLVWPESAFPFLLAQHPEALAAIGALLPPGAILVTGAARAEAASGNAPGKVFNSVYVIDDRGQFLDVYDKVHLVPFGEYLPFQETLEAAGIQQLTALPGGFSAGQERRTLSISPVPPFGPLVCYEIIFPSEVVEAGNRPRWLLNVTNDAWYGNTPGPYQHFEQARVRAVEEGLPLVRAANTGISAIVDGYGRIIGELGLEREGVVDGPLPTSLSVTPYGRYGDLIFLIMLVVACVVATVTKLARNVIDN